MDFQGRRPAREVPMTQPRYVGSVRAAEVPTWDEIDQKERAMSEAGDVRVGVDIGNRRGDIELGHRPIL